ncbi:hypothetical protein F4806DRAFT_415049 [Annulohypoxylon nitens]|nr:hypothetical protein F4806DRAFT_415049 [Annulohypoxylon nitens]
MQRSSWFPPTAISILAGCQLSLSANEQRQNMGPVILLQNNHPNPTSPRPVFTSWTIQKQRPPRGYTSMLRPKRTIASSSLPSFMQSSRLGKWNRIISKHTFLYLLLDREGKLVVIILHFCKHDAYRCVPVRMRMRLRCKVVITGHRPIDIHNIPLLSRFQTFQLDAESAKQFHFIPGVHIIFPYMYMYVLY